LFVNFLGDIAATLENNISGSTAFMKKPTTIARAIQRKRQQDKRFPKKPQTFDDIKSLPAHLTETSDRQKFLVLNDTVYPNNPSPNAKRLLVFMSEVGRDILVKSDTWYCDGTFQAAASTLFAQIFLVIGLTGTRLVDYKLKF
jgi:hypothetical protein